MLSNVVQFLSGKGFDHKGRTLNQIRAFPDWRLEKEHDVIQWMFPIDIPSKHFDGAPVLTNDDIKIIKKSKDIQYHLILSLSRMMRFYEQNDYWITQKNHNFLRITRILRCLWLSGRKHDYVCIQKILDKIWVDYHDIIGNETFLYWKCANNKDFLINHKPTPVSIPVANNKTNPYDENYDDVYEYP